MRDAFARVLEEEMAQNERIVLITGDLGFGVLRQIHRRFPDRLINAGIAEQGMVSMAAGLATTGRTVLVYSIGNFPVLRPLEQIRNDCVYHKADVKIVCVGGGFVYGSLGMSHHATEDMSVMRAIPDMICYTPGDPAETEAVTHDMIWRKGTCYLRLGRGNEPKVHEGPVKGWSFPKAITLRGGRDIAILSCGGILTQAMDAAERLAAKGITCNAVAPGFVETDMTAGLESKKEQLFSAIPLGRFAAPEEIADAVWFLLRSEYITGEVLRVDGGIAI